jgi:hypothetical protein
VTFKDLQKLVQSQTSLEQNQLVITLKDKPFWIWNIEQHKQEDIKTKGDCCFNHIIGLPRKDGIEKSIFDYEKLLYGSLLTPEFYNPSKHSFKHKHLWVKKATGLGVTEFMSHSRLRFSTSLPKILVLTFFPSIQTDNQRYNHSTNSNQESPNSTYGG